MTLKLDANKISQILKQLNLDFTTTKKNKFYYYDVSHLLNIVCEKNIYSTVDFLLRNGADINAEDIHHRRPLWFIIPIFHNLFDMISYVGG